MVYAKVTLGGSSPVQKFYEGIFVDVDEVLLTLEREWGKSRRHVLVKAYRLYHGSNTLQQSAVRHRIAQDYIECCKGNWTQLPYYVTSAFVRMTIPR